jgi:hypothetical protein
MILTSYSPYWAEKSKLYKINDLAFQGEWAMKNSAFIQEFLMPIDSMNDPNNPKRNYLWERYKNSALYTNYPLRYLKQAIGLVTKEKYECFLPPSMQKIEEYASLENLSLQAIEVEALESIIKFGSALIVTHIIDESLTSQDTPRMEVIPGCNVLDAEAVYDSASGLDVFKRIVYYKQEYKFNDQTNSYERPEIYLYICGLTEDGVYYEAKMLDSMYSKFNFKNPIECQDSCESLSFPSWNSPINFIPAVYVNKDNLKLEWKESPIQNLIDTSLSIFQMTADMRFLMHQQSSSTLVIQGTDVEGQSIRTGVGNVLNLVDSGASANYIAPSVAGLQAMQTCLTEQHSLAQQSLLTLTDAGAGSSGEALALRMNDKTSELIGIVSIIGKAIQRELEMIGIIMGENIDNIIFNPYIAFLSTNEDETVEQTLDQKNEEKDINKI